MNTIARRQAESLEVTLILEREKKEEELISSQWPCKDN